MKTTPNMNQRLLSVKVSAEVTIPTMNIAPEINMVGMYGPRNPFRRASIMAA
jgi:hypothetical protein